MMHVLTARVGDRWAAWHQEAPGLDWSPIANEGRLRLNVVVDAALDFAFKTRQPMAFSFTTRQFQDAAGNVAMVPEEIAHVARGVEIEILMAEGRWPGDTRWKAVRRDAVTGRVSCIGSAESAFQGQTLKDQLRTWFEGRGLGRPETVLRWHSELYARPGEAWKARTICPDSFADYPFHTGPILTDEQQARRMSRMPQTKSAVRRAKHQANAQRFRAEAAERARLRGEVA